MKKPKGFFTYFHLITVIEKLSDAQAGRLYKALMRYGDSGELTDFSDDVACDMAYTLMKGEIDVNFERYNEICENKKKAAVLREERRRATPQKHWNKNNRSTRTRVKKEAEKEKADNE